MCTSTFDNIQIPYGNICFFRNMCIYLIFPNMQYLLFPKFMHKLNFPSFVALQVIELGKFNTTFGETNFVANITYRKVFLPLLISLHILTSCYIENSCPDLLKRVADHFPKKEISTLMKRNERHKSKE